MSRPIHWVRWGNIPYLPLEDMLKLHDRELILARNFEGKEKIDDGKGPFTEHLDMLIYLCRKNNLTPFFPTTMPEIEKRIRLDAFFSSIYKIWSYIFDKHGYPKEPGELRESEKLNETTETKVVHEADTAIWESGYRISRDWKTDKEETIAKREAEVKSDLVAKSRMMRQAQGLSPNPIKQDLIAPARSLEVPGPIQKSVASHGLDRKDKMSGDAYQKEDNEEPF